MTGHSILVWGPAAEGEKSASGRVLPAGWVWTCECGDSAAGFATEALADASALAHEDQQEAAVTTGTPQAPPGPDDADAAGQASSAVCKGCGSEWPLGAGESLSRCPACGSKRLTEQPR